MGNDLVRSKSAALGKVNATALAIGTGLSMTGTSEAAVVYNDDVSFGVFGYGTTDIEYLDVNNDGVNDFRFSHYFRPQGSCGYYGYYGYYGGCYIRHFGNSDMTAQNGAGMIVGKLAEGTYIGGGQNFLNTGVIESFAVDNFGAGLNDPFSGI